MTTVAASFSLLALLACLMKVNDLVNFQGSLIELNSTYVDDSFMTEHGCESSHCFALVLVEKIGLREHDLVVWWIRAYKA